MNRQIQLLLVKNICEMTRQTILNWLDELEIPYCDTNNIKDLRGQLYNNVFHQLFNTMEPSDISNLFDKLGLVQVKSSRRLSTLSGFFKKNPDKKMNILKLMSGDNRGAVDGMMVSVNNSGLSSGGLKLVNPSDNSCFVNVAVNSLVTNSEIKKRLMSSPDKTLLIAELRRLVVNCQTVCSSAQVRSLVSHHYISTQGAALRPEKFDDRGQHDVAIFYLALLNCLGGSLDDLVSQELEETIVCCSPVCRAPPTKQVLKLFNLK